MQLGMVGLGRMGANIVRRFMRDGHDCVAFDVNPGPVAAARAEERPVGFTLAGLCQPSSAPRAVWLMIPAGFTVGAVDESPPSSTPGHHHRRRQLQHRDDVRRAVTLKELSIHYVDVGTSGGVFGLERGYCLMVVGPDAAVALIDPLLQDDRPRTWRHPPHTRPRRRVRPRRAGYLHCGPVGAGTS